MVRVIYAHAQRKEKREARRSCACAPKSVLVPRTHYSFLAPRTHYSFLVPRTHYSFLVPRTSYSFLVPRTQYSFLVPRTHYSFLVPRTHYSFLVPRTHYSFVVPRPHYSSLVPRTHYSFLVPRTHHSFLVPRTHYSRLLPRTQRRFTEIKVFLHFILNGVHYTSHCILFRNHYHKLPMASVFCADSDNFLLTCERGVGGGGRGVSKFSTAINGSKPLTCPSQFDKFRPTTGKLLIPLPLPPFHFFLKLWERLKYRRTKLFQNTGQSKHRQVFSEVFTKSLDNQQA